MIFTVLSAVVVPNVCLAGFGKPASCAEGEMKDGEALAQARALLKQKGYDQGEVDAALAKLGRERIAMLEREAAQAKAGGFLDLLFFILIVALIVWLVIVLIEAPYDYRYRRRYY